MQHGVCPRARWQWGVRGDCSTGVALESLIQEPEKLRYRAAAEAGGFGMDSEWLNDNFSSIRSVRERGKCQLYSSSYMRSLENSRNTWKRGRCWEKGWSPKIVSRGESYEYYLLLWLWQLFFCQSRGELGNKKSTYAQENVRQWCIPLVLYRRWWSTRWWMIAKRKSTLFVYTPLELGSLVRNDRT